MNAGQPRGVRAGVPALALGWSTVSQAGYLLMAVAVAGRSDLALPSLALYLAA